MKQGLITIKSIFQKQFQFSVAQSLIKLQQLPVIQRKKDDILIKNWWSERPFDSKTPLVVPIFNFQTGEFTNEGVELEQQIFNVPLRRDVVHSVYQWRLFYKKSQTHITRTKGTTAGSGKKPFKQKGTGNARQGNKRAPGRKKGGKAHGPQPRSLSYTIPNKKKILALKTLLSARLAEGKLRIVDNEKIEVGKTKIVKNILDQYDEQLILFIGSYQMDENFLRAQENLQQIKVTMPHEINIIDLLNRRVIITVQGLQQLQQHIKDQDLKSFKLRNMPQLESIKQREEIFQTKKKEVAFEQLEYDPKKPLELKSKILQEYLIEYEKQKLLKEKPIQNE